MITIKLTAECDGHVHCEQCGAAFPKAWLVSHIYGATTVGFRHFCSGVCEGNYFRRNGGGQQMRHRPAVYQPVMA